MISEVLKWFEDNIYYSVNSGNATFSIQNEDLGEFEELLKKQDRKLQQKESIIKEVREYINSIGWNTTIPNIQDNVWRILDKEEE